MKLLTASLIALAASAPLSAKSVTGPATVQAGSYKVDPSHVLVEFEVNHFGFSQFFGVFPAATGTLTLDPSNLAAAKVDVAVPVERVSTTNAKLDGELVGADWFDAAKYPVIRFVSTKVTRTGTGTARIAGNLILHGVSKPFVLDATFVGAGSNPLSKAYTVGFKASGHLKRSDFGVSKYVPLVSDEVTLTIAAPFEKTN